LKEYQAFQASEVYQEASLKSIAAGIVVPLLADSSIIILAMPSAILPAN